MKVAALDLGTNSFLLLIAEVEKGRITKVYQDESRVVRLGEKVNQEKEFQPSALMRAEECLQEFSRIIARSGKIEKTLAAATSAARDAKNADELFAIGKKFGIPITVISGKKEMELTYNGMVFDRDKRDGIVGLDIGGGSTEVVFEKDKKISGESVDVGCVRLSEMFLKSDPVSESEFKKMCEYAKKHLLQFSEVEAKEVIAVAGTPTTLACLEKQTDFDSKKIHGTKLSLNRIEHWMMKLLEMTNLERSKLPGIGKRADVILAGAALMFISGHILNVKEFTVSVWGARCGLALELGK